MTTNEQPKAQPTREELRARLLARVKRADAKERKAHEAREAEARARVEAEQAGIAEARRKHAEGFASARLYKVLDKDGKPQSGGSKDFRWSLPQDGLPGEWTEYDSEGRGLVVRCGNGLHLTYVPSYWKHAATDRIFEAEGSGQSDPPTLAEAHGTKDGKIAFPRARLLREITDPEELARVLDIQGPPEHSYYSSVPFGGYRSRRSSGFPRNRQEAELTLLLSRNDRKKLANNTYLERDSQGNPAVRFHSTRIVTFLPRGRVRVTTGGWHSSTTKDRINRCGIQVYSAGYGVWAIGGAEYSDGMEFSLSKGPSIRKHGSAEDEVRRLRREAGRRYREERKRRAIEAEAEVRRIHAGEHRSYCDKSERTSWCKRNGTMAYQPSGLCGCGIVVNPANRQELPQATLPLDGGAQ